MGRPDFKSVWGSEPVSGGFDSHSPPPAATARTDVSARPNSMGLGAKTCDIGTAKPPRHDRNLIVIPRSSSASGLPFPTRFRVFSRRCGAISKSPGDRNARAALRGAPSCRPRAIPGASPGRDPEPWRARVLDRQIAALAAMDARVRGHDNVGSYFRPSLPSRPAMTGTSSRSPGQARRRACHFQLGFKCFQGDAAPLSILRNSQAGPQ